MCYIPFSTVARIIKKFEAAGYQLAQVDPKKPRTYALMLPYIKDLLLDQDLLQTWHPYSLAERTQLLAKATGCQVSVHTLWNFYRDHGIKIRTGQAVYR